MQVQNHSASFESLSTAEYSNFSIPLLWVKFYSAKKSIYAEANGQHGYHTAASFISWTNNIKQLSSLPCKNLDDGKKKKKARSLFYTACKHWICALGTSLVQSNLTGAFWDHKDAEASLMQAEPSVWQKNATRSRASVSLVQLRYTSYDRIEVVSKAKMRRLLAV